MKRLLFILVAFTTILVSCKKEQKEMPTVSFETATGVQIDENTEFTAVRTMGSNKDSVVINVNFSGTAIMDVDYTVSSKQFVLGGKNPINKIVVKPFKLGTKKTVILSMQAPQGYNVGKIGTASCTLSDKLGYVTFKEASYLISSGMSKITVNLLDGNGNLLKANKKLPLKISVDKANSTAVEGENYQILNKDSLYFEPGKNSLDINIKYLKSEENKDKLVLVIDDQELFSVGENYKTDITFADYRTLINGKWSLVKIDPTLDDYAQSWGFDKSVMTGYPVPQKEDGFEIKIDKSSNSGKFIPNFSSEFKNYFIGTSDIKLGAKVTTYSGIKQFPVDSYMLNNVNRNFDASKMSEDKEGLIGITFDHSPDDLLMFVFDFKSTSFAKDLIGLNMYLTNKPVANVGGILIVASFHRQN